MSSAETVAADPPEGLPYEAMFLASPVPASLSRERDGRLVAINDAWLALSGLRREEVIGRTTVELGHWPSEAARQDYLRRLPEGPSHQELCLGTSHIQHFRIHTSRLPMQPEPLLLVFLFDVTAQVTAEQTLKHTNVQLEQRLELFTAIEKLASAGHWTNAADDEAVIWSAGLHELAGIPPQASLSRQEGRGGIHPNDRAAWLAAREAMDGRTVEFRWQRPDDGRQLWLRSRMGRTTVADNPQTDFGVVQDVTAEKTVAQALAAQLAFVQQVAARVPGVLFEARVRPDGTSVFGYMSERARDMLELDPALLAVEGNRFFERVHPEDKRELIVSLIRCSELLVPWRGLYRVQLPRQGLRWYVVDALPQRKDDGSTSWYGFCNDVTVAHQAQEALQRQHRMLVAVQQAQAAFIESDDKRSAFASLLDALLAVTGSEYGYVAEVLYDGREQPYLKTHAISNIAWDEASRRLHDSQVETGLEFRRLDTLLGHALVTRQPVIANDPARDPRAGGLPSGHEPLRAFLGVPLTVGDRLVAMVGLANQPGGYAESDVEFLQPLLGATRQLVIAWRGHAERKRARLQFQSTSQLLAEKSTALQVTFDSINQGLVQLDASGRVRFYNRRLVEMLGLPTDALGANPTLQEVFEFQRQRGDFGEGFSLVEDPMRAHMAGEVAAAEPSSYLRRTPDGRVLEILSRPLPDGGSVRTFTDVTSYVQVQEEVRALNASLERRVAERTAELERSMQDMEAISYSIAHDLRAPLRSVNGFAALILESDGDHLSATARDMFGRIERSSRYMGQMISDMLELLRVVRVELSPAPVDMNRQAQLVVEALAPAVPHARVAVQPLPPVMGDATLMRQLLMNLMDNALKYSRHREQPELTLGYDAQQQAFWLRDNGMGFDMARANKLFGLFQRLHAGSGVPGTGVGLAIVARIIERHGGRIWAESRPDAGSTFWWRLPLCG